MEAKGKIVFLLSAIALLVALLSLYSTPIKAAIFRAYLNRSESERRNTLGRLNMLEIATKKDELDFWLSVLGPEVLMDELLRDAGGGSSLDCHRQAHLIGRASYEQYGSVVFTKGNSLCHSGFYHGAMEAFLAQKGTANLAQDIIWLCSSFGTDFEEIECYHGVGHGILAYEDYDLPTALSHCKTLPASSQTSCFGGVFMENLVTAEGKGADPAHTTSWVNNDPHFPCNAFPNEPELEAQCYHMQTSRMLVLFQNDFDRVLGECLKAPEKMRRACFRSFGRDAAGQVLREPLRIVQLCSKVPASHSYVDECVIGALHVIIDFWGKDLNDQASAFCKALPDQRKNTCYHALAERLPGLFKNASEAQRVCRTFEAKYQSLCLSE